MVVAVAAPLPRRVMQIRLTSPALTAVVQAWARPPILQHQRQRQAQQLVAWAVAVGACRGRAQAGNSSRRMVAAEGSHV